MPEELGDARPFSAIRRKGILLYSLARETVDPDSRTGFPERISSVGELDTSELHHRSRKTWKDNWQMFNNIRLRGVTVSRLFHLAWACWEHNSNVRN